MSEYFVQLEKKFNNKQSVSGVDIDIFANNIKDREQLEELEHFIYRFRRSRNTVKLFDSTAHSAIRSFLQYQDYESVFRILQNPVDYGIFPDYYCYNILMDTFLNQKNYRDATKIAVLMMLQDDFNHPISKRLALYSCHMYLREPLPSPYVVDKAPAENQKPSEDGEEEEEEVYIRVPFLTNPFFDDHFDLKEPKLLIGKTAYVLGREIEGIVGRTYQLLGLGMYEKWDKISKLLDEFSSYTEKPVVLETAVTKCRELIDAVPTNDGDGKVRKELLEEIKLKLDNVGSSKTIDGYDLHDLVLKIMEEVPQFEEEDIESQRELYNIWEENRQKAVDTQIQEYLAQEKLKLIESKKKDISEKEQLLYFFENWNKIEMELEEVKKLEAEVKKGDEDYIPPDVRRSPI